MKNELNFWSSLEIYLRKIVGRSPIPYTYIGVLIVLLVLVTSVFNVKNSVVGLDSLGQVIIKSAKSGDYTLAEELFKKLEVGQSGNNILGSESELEDVVYPEKIVERRIFQLENKLVEYPGNREIYLELAGLYGQLGHEEQSNEYREKARILDPNNDITK